MKITHVISGEITQKRSIILQQYGFLIPRGFSRFEMIEDDRYFHLKGYFDEWGFNDSGFSQFDINEIEEAKYLKCNPLWQTLYPEPSLDGGFLDLTYDTTHYCGKDFGTGLVQKAPFRIRKAPKWGKHKIFLLNWIFDELFVHPHTYEKVFKPLGIETLPVLQYKKDIVIDSVVQLILPETKVSLNLDGYEKEVKCNTVKYHLINKGFFPNFKEEIPSDLKIFKSREYFAGGAEARKMIFVTQNLRRRLIEEKIELSYHPLYP